MDPSLSQPSILTLPAPLARFRIFDLVADRQDAAAALCRLRDALPDGRADGYVVGIGEPLALALGADVPGLSSFPALSGPGHAVPSTQGALLCVNYGQDLGEVLHDARFISGLLEDAFELQEVIDGFTYGEGRDLTGYMDGTENPEGDKAARAALVDGRGPGLDAGSCVVVQRWVHDLDAFQELSSLEQDHVIGRSRATDEELDDAPESAHVKRAEQEAYEPQAFMLRRSMPYATEDEEGLCFVAFAASFSRYEMILRRMLGLDDGIVDSLFSFSRPVGGGFYFCPPMDGERVDLRALGL